MYKWIGQGLMSDIPEPNPPPMFHEQNLFQASSILRSLFTYDAMEEKLAFLENFASNSFRKKELKRNELQTEPLDLTISRVCGGRIEPPDASIAETSGGQAELSETDHEDAARRKHPENTTHTGEKRFKCEISKKNFVAPSSTHTMNHANEKPHSCSECNMSFIWPSYLDRHMKIHTGEKPYSCSECGKNFAQSAGLYSHKQIHTGKKPYSSSECGKNFTHSSNLRTHEKIHTGEKHSCLKCNKSFSQSGNMRRHMKVHGNAGPDSVELYEVKLSCGNSL
uniref:Zinc finger protein n=1 Tax=Loa loa TaxID=7209 RepID=A0A1I7VCA4_LOALO